MSAKCFSAIFIGASCIASSPRIASENTISLELQLSNLFCEIFFSVHDMETVGFTNNLVLLFERLNCEVYCNFISFVVNNGKNLFKSLNSIY
jgi:hypothetical protein